MEDEIHYRTKEIKYLRLDGEGEDSQTSYNNDNKLETVSVTRIPYDGESESYSDSFNYDDDGTITSYRHGEVSQSFLYYNSNQIIECLYQNDFKEEVTYINGLINKIV
ncbi:hypothetical protein [Carboxylicivirga caseinilyticus]|uniref:hypothetical protein n=1 Tax=Carboxylicivirga caseinilyticus TaxID=3417572 RepID=UPI003D350231|nr:hypothetical protein [Marinilabiliaceae bacterium A049]